MNDGSRGLSRRDLVKVGTGLAVAKMLELGAKYKSLITGA